LQSLKIIFSTWTSCKKQDELKLLCLVCFKEIKFQEFIFLIFQCLAIIRKLGQRKINSSQQKNLLYPQESVFLSLSKGKHFPIFTDKTHLNPSLHLCPKTIEKQEDLRITLFISGIFSLKFLYYFSILFPLCVYLLRIF